MHMESNMALLTEGDTVSHRSRNMALLTEGEYADR